jgi:hypothetical protein
LRDRIVKFEHFILEIGFAAGDEVRLLNDAPSVPELRSTRPDADSMCCRVIHQNRRRETDPYFFSSPHRADRPQAADQDTQ